MCILVLDSFFKVSFTEEEQTSREGAILLVRTSPGEENAHEVLCGYSTQTQTQSISKDEHGAKQTNWN